MEKFNIDLLFQPDEQVQKEMEESLYSSPIALKYITKKLEIPENKIKENIAKIYDFVLDVKYCENCPGLKKCNKPNPYLCTTITYKNGIVDSVITPCKKMLQQIKFEKQFVVRDFDDAWLTHSIKQMDGKDNFGRKSAIKKYSEYKSGKSDDWIYLQGNSNSGKTYVASQICVDIARAEGGPICFIDSSKRFKELLDMSYKEKGKFDELLDRFSNCPVLVIDDFGNGFYNDYIRDGILFPIISNRAKKRLFTIFTSSYSYDDIITILGTTKAGAIKMKQIVETIKNKAGIEINLGDFSIY